MEKKLQKLGEPNLEYVVKNRGWEQYRVFPNPIKVYEIESLSFNPQGSYTHISIHNLIHFMSSHYAYDNL